MTKRTATLALLITLVTAPAVARAENTQLKAPFTGDAGRGIGLAYENGSWGGNWSQGVRVRVPLGQHFGLHVRTLMIADFGDRIDAGGRLDFVGQSGVILNVMRLYGGGGVQVLRPVSGVENKETALGGGGHFGFEFFMSEWMSWIVEIGGNSGGSDSFGAGATIIAGVQFHPWAAN